MIISKPYDPARAVEYARRWARSRNPLFYDFTGGGGNCTNFVSQSLLAGSLVMNGAPTFGWYYTSVNDRAPAWTGVEAFYDFMCGVGDFPPTTERAGPFCEEIAREGAAEGDVVQLANARGEFYHTLIISRIMDDGEILVCAQSNDALDRPLSTYNYASARFLHVLGVNIEIFENLEYFTALIGGTSLLPKDQIYLPVPATAGGEGAEV